jgi:hypothetical protein
MQMQQTYLFIYFLMQVYGSKYAKGKIKKKTNMQINIKFPIGELLGTYSHGVRHQ